MGSDGSAKRKQHRVANRCQTYGIDYLETFTPIAKLNNVRVLISIAANLDWPLQRLDVNNTFLNSNLKEKVYMDLPPRFDEHFGYLCKGSVED